MLYKISARPALCLNATSSGFTRAIMEPKYLICVVVGTVVLSMNRMVGIIFGGPLTTPFSSGSATFHKV